MRWTRESADAPLLTFARKEELAVHVIPLNTCVDNAMVLLRSSVRSAVLTIDLTEGPCEVLADGGLVEACLLNLCINARDARPEGCRDYHRNAVDPDGRAASH